VFIGSAERERLVNIAERAGFPQNCCTWIKGIYGACMEYGIETVLCVTSGDCSNTIMLMEVLKLKGLDVLPFAYPDQPDVDLMQRALEDLAESLGTTLARAEEMRRELEEARRLALELDELTWKGGVVSGLENHLSLVATSDFGGDYREYERHLEGLLSQEVESPIPMTFFALPISACLRCSPAIFTLILSATEPGWSSTKYSASSPCRSPAAHSPSSTQATPIPTPYPAAFAISFPNCADGG